MFAQATALLEPESDDEESAPARSVGGADAAATAPSSRSAGNKTKRNKRKPKAQTAKRDVEPARDAGAGTLAQQ